jgi:hypothetical protein
MLTTPQKSNEIAATVKEAGPEDDAEQLEKERQALQEIIDNGNKFPLGRISC